MLPECTGGLRCVLAYHPAEEPNVFLDVVAHPLWSLALAVHFVGHAVDARTFARTALEAAYLLGGDGALGVLAMMSTEATYGDYHRPVYPPGLGALSSWLPWAVRVIEEAAAQGEFVPESIAESAPLLAAARFEVARRKHWPSARSAWSWMHSMPAQSRGEEAAWHAAHARIEALTDAIDQAEAGPLPSAANVSPGDLVRIPQKGVTMVLAGSEEADVVAAYARPQRARVAYPKGVLPLCRLGVSVPFFGAPSDDAEARGWRHFNDVVHKLREKNPEEPPTHHALLQNILNDIIGLETYVAGKPTGHALRAELRDILHHITVPCDPLLAAHAEAQLPGLLDAVLKGVPEGDRLALQQALTLRALNHWLRGEDASEVVARTAS
jgi:hypothetical protein